MRDEDRQIRDKVQEAIEHSGTVEETEALVDLIKSEKAKAYNVGFHDGTRKVGPFIGRQ